MNIPNVDDEEQALVNAYMEASDHYLAAQSVLQWRRERAEEGYRALCEFRENKARRRPQGEVL